MRWIVGLAVFGVGCYVLPGFIAATMAGLALVGWGLRIMAKPREVAPPVQVMPQTTMPPPADLQTARESVARLEKERADAIENGAHDDVLRIIAIRMSKARDHLDALGPHD